MGQEIKNIKQIKNATTEKKRAATMATIFFVIAIFLMCVLKLWFTMFILFAFALIVTLVSGKANYCTHFCPMGLMMDNCGSKNYKEKKGFKYNKLLRVAVQLLFYGSIVATIVTKEGSNSLWSGMLVIMLSMGFGSILLQEMLGKRYFCIHLCPYRLPFMSKIISFRRFIKKSVKK